MIRSMPLVDDLGQRPEREAGSKCSTFPGAEPSLASACLETPLRARLIGERSGGWELCKGYRRLQGRSVKRSSSSSLKLRAPLAIIESACGNSSQTGAYASVTPALVSLFLRGFALPPFALALVACAIGQAG